MSLVVVAHRDDTIMLTDREDGPGAIVYLDGETAVFHIDTALSAGYWEDSDAEGPTLPASAVTELRAFNARWHAAQAARDTD